MDRPARCRGCTARPWSRQSVRRWKRTTCPMPCRVIISRAIPEIDGFKPSHRKLLYTMYKMGLLTGGRTKSANIVGQTMRLNPHGDAGHLRDDGAPWRAATKRCCTRSSTQRATSARSIPAIWPTRPRATPRRSSTPSAPELFRDIDIGHGRFCGQLRQHHAGADAAAGDLPERARLGQHGHRRRHGVSNICCIQPRARSARPRPRWIENPERGPALGSRSRRRISPTGGEMLYDAAEMAEIYRTGRGTVRIRARWRYIKEGNLHRDL